MCCVGESNPETGTNTLIPLPFRSRFPEPGGLVNSTTTSAVNVSSDVSPVVPLESQEEILSSRMIATVHVLMVINTFAVSEFPNGSSIV